jgi:aspartyl-tRNA(Asn)/glutamyl-tRNA(Gln) amidotransferase subunit B
LFNPDTGETRAMRTKEDAADYRYFPDPDLPPLVISREWVEQVRHEMGESKPEIKKRFQAEYHVTSDEAKDLTGTRDTAMYFEAATKLLVEINPANWPMPNGLSDAKKTYGSAIAKGVNNLLAAQLNREGLSIVESKVSAANFARIHARMIDKTLSAKTAREAFLYLWESPDSDDEQLLDKIIKDKDLKQMNDSGELEKIIDEVLAAHPKNVEEYKAGNAKALNGLVGPIMKASKGKANPAQVNALLLKKLG